MGSIGVRFPLNTLTADSRIRNAFATPTTTAVNDLAVYTKYILAQDRATGSLVSVGLQVTPPTGPKTFASSKFINAFHSVEIQPYSLNSEFHRSTWLTFGYVTPVTGPKPFDFEVVALLNITYGRSRNRGYQPPIAAR